MTKSRFGFNFMGAKPQYTPTEKKGEINELKAQIKQADQEKDQTKKRECLKKVIAYMTLGIDTAPLFTDMIMACVTKDLVQKKMVYFYLSSHAETNSEVAILAINTLQKDCRDESPVVRGLALRSISSLRLPSLVEYLVPTLKETLGDSSPYVRKTAIIASCKLFKSNAEEFERLGMRDKLNAMIKDNDAHVCCNALMVLNEIMEAEGGLPVTRLLLYPLLNRLRDFNEWQKCFVLQLTLKYQPENEKEMFKIMNILEEFLWGANSAVILAATHLFLHLTQNLPQLHRQVYTRLKKPLCTLIATAPMETAYACLCHIKLLISREPEPFVDLYKDFYCRYNDPTFVKSLKLEILVLIANDQNNHEIMTELAAYVTDVQVETVRKSIKSLGEIALKTDAGKVAVDHLLEFLAMDVPFVRSETLDVLKDFLRRYTDPQLINPFFPAIIESWKEIDDPSSKVAFVWILGEFGEHIDDAPYILETYCENFKEEPHQVRLELLTACMKLFFKRPPELQVILGPLLNEAISDFSHADVHDRALLYYRLLLKNPSVAASVVCCRKEPVEHFETNERAEVKDKLFEEFNSLSVVFNMPAERFMKSAEDLEGEEDEESDEEEDEEEEEEEEEEESDDEQAARGLLAEPKPKKMAATGAFALDPNPTIDTNEYQQQFMALPLAAQGDIYLKPGLSQEAISGALKNLHVNCLAFGPGPAIGSTKFFFFATCRAQGILSECVSQPNGTFSMTIKAAVPQLGLQYQEFVKNALAALK
eukprot:TRINITY_DN6803_c1_g1_i1.p1 TRINITY_DN6803_c1_g1~~TRINITY_DN6803_c1_g1_i1.p1  ORF type:complete len:763 (+),score=368.79 TRINITY_DN6803_c1_g1_i1:122-2410(+)